jgi:putative transposase
LKATKNGRERFYPLKDPPMADEMSLPIAVATMPTEPYSNVKEKKTRAPRKPKTVAEAVVDTSVSAPVKKTRGPSKKAVTASVPVAAEPATKAPAPASKATAAKAQPAKRAPKVAAAPVDTDGFADLLKLEEENQKLRKELSGKLRAENADLRKKLGMA